MDNLTAELFQQGVDDYYAGHVPDDWNDSDARERSPYLMGWWMESNFDTGQEELDERNR